MADLVDLLLTLLSREDPRRLGERLLDAAVARYDGRRAALWLRKQERCTLFLSRHVDQGVLDAVQAVWTSRREALRGGQVLTAREGSGPRELREAIEGTPARSAVLAPVVAEQRTIGLLYMEAAEQRFASPEDLDGVRQLSRVAAVALSSTAPFEAPRQVIAAYLENMSEQAVARDQLLVLLERNDWNVARVARALGVTRATVYQRLARFEIPRQRWRPLKA
jgi:transcriptional regulator with GAF, ATPase, and Fis domain